MYAIRFHLRIRSHSLETFEETIQFLYGGHYEKQILTIQ